MSKKLIFFTSLSCLLAAFLGFTWYGVEKGADGIKELAPLSGKENMSSSNKEGIIYIYTPMGGKLQKEEITVKTTMSKDEILQTAIQNVINNLQSKKILKTSEVYKFKVYLEDRDVYLDLSSNILSHVGDAKEELLIIYSFVNTICNLGGVDRVKFLIDGKSVERVKYINLTKFYEKNMEM